MYNNSYKHSDMPEDIELEYYTAQFIENCHRAFFGLVYTYYNSKLCQRQFGRIF